MKGPGVFEKLNLKDAREVLILDAPASFEPELRKLKGVTLRRELPADASFRFALVFAVRKAEVDSVARPLSKACQGDAVVWFAYPKGSSKRFSCDFNRDTGWDVLGTLGFEPVRQVALDEDWSALRFRRIEFIQSLRRAPQRASSVKGRQAAERARSRRSARG
jgi:hypothetical protein